MALRDTHVGKRQELFTFSKPWCTFHRSLVTGASQKTPPAAPPPGPLPHSLASRLQAWASLLPTGYIRKRDSSNTDFVDTWTAVDQLVDDGLVKAIGASNFICPWTERFLNKPSLTYKPVVSQLECPPLPVPKSGEDSVLPL